MLELLRASALLIPVSYSSFKYLSIFLGEVLYPDCGSASDVSISVGDEGARSGMGL